MLILDTEVYKNYFLASFKSIESGEYRHLEFYRGADSSVIGQMLSILNMNLTVGFNSNSYDLPILAAFISGWGCQKLHALSKEIIESGKPAWVVCKDHNITVPAAWDHIDLIEVAPSKASLKLYGGRMHAPKIQDLPIGPDASIDPSDREVLRGYCQNDLDTTELLYRSLEKQIGLRVAMSEQYGMDLRSKSDAQIAETVIKSELEKLTHKTYRKAKLVPGQKYRYRDPKFIRFESDILRARFQKMLGHEFEVGGKGTIKAPDFLREIFTLGASTYQMGIGGLHSCEKSRLLRSNEKELLVDWDVASYYPSIILEQELAPKAMGKPFLNVYRSLVTRRLKAKKRGNKVVADTLKICVNGSFGKLANQYSALYAPDLFLQVTLTGQLALLMLIERMENAGIKVVSANTDGVVCLVDRSKIRAMEDVAWNWELDTTYLLERAEYKALASRDVNNYVAVTTDGKVKRKGVFAAPGLMKNPDQQIVYKAVAAYIAEGVPVDKTIRASKDIRDFLIVRRVQGGAEWGGRFLGKAVRFYRSNEVPHAQAITYKTNGNSVTRSQGCRPLMDLPEAFPDDVQYEHYIREANDMLDDIGYQRKLC